MSRPALACLIVVAGLQPCVAIITTSSTNTLPNNQSPTAETDRFHNAPNDNGLFLQEIPGSSFFDFTGVGQASACANASGPTSVGTCWATMISPTLFLSATHSHPSEGATVSFFDDGGNLIASRSVSSVSTLSGPLPNSLATPTNSDLWIGELSSAVPSGVEKYAIGTPTIDSSIAIQVGIGGAITSGGLTRHFRAGQNTLDAMVNNLDTDGVVGTSDFLLYVDNSTQGSIPVGTALPTDLDYETRFQGGDSGGPSFIASGTTLQLAGIHSFISDLTLFETRLDENGDPVTITTERKGSADVRVASYQDAINSKISAAAVPEPSGVLLLLLVAALVSFKSYLARRL